MVPVVVRGLALSLVLDVPSALLFVLSIVAAEPRSNTPMPWPQMVPSPAASAQRAEGPFRFSEQVWLEAIKSTVTDDALNAMAGRIFMTSNGRYYVPVAAERQAILGQRNDPVVAATVVEAFARRNAQILKGALHHDPSAGDLYAAHLLGSALAIRLIEVAQATPEALALKVLPEVATAIPNFGSSGPAQRLGARRLYDLLVRQVERNASPAVVARAAPARVEPTLRGPIADGAAPEALALAGSSSVWRAAVNRPAAPR